MPVLISRSPIDPSSSLQPSGSTTAARNPSVTRSNLHASLVDGVSYGAMVGLGESYFAAFALAVGLGEISAGMVASVPLFFGGVAQLVSPWAVRRLGFEQAWVIGCGIVQAVSLLVMGIAAILGSISLAWLLCFASVYWASALATGPAWNTWIEAIVPKQIRTTYFARRTKWAQGTTFAGLVAGGFVLQQATVHHWLSLGFALLFFLASACRCLSVAMLIRHRTEIRMKDRSLTAESFHTDRSLTVSQHPARRLVLRAGAGSRAEPSAKPLGISALQLLAYLVVVQGMVQLSGPYFAPYMLEHLEFSYDRYVSLIALGFAAKVVALSFWGRFGRRFGAKRMLWIGGIGIVPIASLWIVSTQFWWLAFAQILSGIVWGAYELGFFLLIFDAVPASKRTKMLTYYNFANCTSWCIGAAAGGAILSTFGMNQQAYWILFGVSSIGRLSALALLIGLQPPRRMFNQIVVRVLSVRANGIGLDTPVLPSLERTAQEQQAA